MKLQQWRGFPGTFAMESALVLEFAIWINRAGRTDTSE